MDNDRLYIPLKRRSTFLFALLFLFLAVAMLVQPILSYVLPIDATGARLFKDRAVAFIFALLLGVPLSIISFSLFSKLRHRYAIIVNEKGWFIYSGIFSLGFISWSDIHFVAYHTRMISNELRKSLVIIFNSDISNVKWQWKLRNCFQTKNSGKLQLNISLFLCEGKDEENAQKIIRIWELYGNK